MLAKHSAIKFLVLFGILCKQSAFSQKSAFPSSVVWTVEVKDISPRFLDFFQTAIDEKATPDQRWQLWKEKYDFAAVPPIAAGQAMAREQLDDAWPKYQAVLPRLRAGAGGIVPNPHRKLDELVSLLEPTEGGRIQLTTFVGTFHRSAFASGKIDGIWRIAIPLEDSDLDHALDMTHEMTHAVQRSSGHWEGQTVGGAIFSEGLAMRTTEKLNSGYEPYIYTASTPEWLHDCQAKLPEVFRDLGGHLNDAGAEAVSKFTIAKGATGLNREVYCAGWFIVGRLLEQERSYSDLAGLTQGDAIALVSQQLKGWQGTLSSGNTTHRAEDSAYASR